MGTCPGVLLPVSKVNLSDTVCRDVSPFPERNPVHRAGSGKVVVSLRWRDCGGFCTFFYVTGEHQIDKLYENGIRELIRSPCEKRIHFN